MVVQDHTFNATHTKKVHKVRSEEREKEKIRSPRALLRDCCVFASHIVTGTNNFPKKSHKIQKNYKQLGLTFSMLFHHMINCTN